MNTEDGRAARYVGVAWSADGYRTAQLDRHGRECAAPAHYGAARTADLVRDLLADHHGGPPLSVVIDSTNGLLDATLTAVGLTVLRADPWHLPARPLLGSAPAHSLALAAVGAPGGLDRLTVASGSLAGRGEEYQRGLARSEPAERELRASGRLVPHGPRGVDAVALTFDDGPDPRHTPRILALLARYGAHATFFTVGMHARAHPDLVRRLVGEGHGVGGHTWSHPFLPDLTGPQLTEQLDRTDEALGRAGSPAARWFRPPYGSRTPAVLHRIGASGRTTVLWDVDSRDWSQPGPDRIAETVLAAARPGSVVLLHDGAGDRSQTVAALPAIIEGLLARGLALVGLDTLLPA
ncbi:polysaccharide deacetylase family protein [Kitasatospora sp. NPDC048538]|uniref:polysaccharide deacetylase family protein n=1 Tax=unclassified Kitasatospora TaxID=2633591 RepID=UPI0033CF0AC0